MGRRRADGVWVDGDMGLLRLRWGVPPFSPNADSIEALSVGGL